ncbi:hypothetical protein [Paraclostridium bifermentans]|uniref:hypothetical protein n=1 Tax=Paraclostridium bifermentans TaxID=1490 RepID=UPI00115B4B59|nr:hypothetical protein [Paraclostridium bifermentans]TQO55603.1 hypothetical protein D5S05_17470 [Paraclostridium bifermentans]
MYIKNNLMRYEYDVCRFAMLLANEEHIEKLIKEYKEYELKLSEQTTHTAIEKRVFSSEVSRLAKKRVSGTPTPCIIKTTVNKNNESYIKEIENFKNREDISYEYNASVNTIHAIMDEFLDYYGEGTIYEVNLESKFGYIRNLESEILWVNSEYDYDEDGEHYYGTYLLYSYCNINKEFHEPDSEILLEEGIIVYDKDNLILITQKYDLILRVLKKEPKKQSEIDFQELSFFEEEQPF